MGIWRSEPTENTAGKKRARQEDVDSDYLFVDAKREIPKVTNNLSLCELFGIESCAVFGIMVSLQSSAIAPSHRFRMARETLARAQPIKMRECSKLVTRLLFREYRFKRGF